MMSRQQAAIGSAPAHAAGTAMTPAALTNAAAAQRALAPSTIAATLDTRQSASATSHAGSLGNATHRASAAATHSASLDSPVDTSTKLAGHAAAALSPHPLRSASPTVPAAAPQQGRSNESQLQQGASGSVSLEEPFGATAQHCGTQQAAADTAALRALGSGQPQSTASVWGSHDRSGDHVDGQMGVRASSPQQSLQLDSVPVEVRQAAAPFLTGDVRADKDILGFYLARHKVLQASQ